MKGRQLDGNAKAALLFHWKSKRRQVRLRGPVERVSDAEADAYFGSRARLAQIGAWASKQSSPLESRLAFEKAIALYTAKFAIGPVPRPPQLVGLSRRAHEHRVLGGPAVPAARPRRVPARAAWRRRGARRGCIREIGSSRMATDAANQPAAPHAAPHRGEPRHRPRHGQALLRRRLAGHHLLAPSVPGKLPVGRRPRGPHPGRSRRPGEHQPRRRRDQAQAHRRRTARAGQQRRDLAQGRGRQAAVVDRYDPRRLAAGVPGQLLRADHAGARPDGRAQGRQRLGGQCHLDRGLAGASVRRLGLRHVEGSARGADARDGRRFRARSASASTPLRRARSTPRSCRPAPKRSSRTSRCTGSARPTRWRRSSMCCAPTRRPT